MLISDSTRYRVAAEDQPNKQLPRLIPVMADSASHMSLARRVNLFQMFCSRADENARTLKKQVCKRENHNGTFNFGIISSRKNMIPELERLKRILEPLNVRLKKKIDSDSSAQALDIALLDFLMKHT